MISIGQFDIVNAAVDFDLDDDDESTQIVRSPILGSDSQQQQRDRCTLVILAGPTPGRMITVDGHEAVVGRGRNVSARIEDGGMSRQHARVFRSGDGWYVEDLGSTNGTYALCTMCIGVGEGIAMVIKRA